MDDGEVLARLAASAPRRAMGVAMLWLLAGLAVYMVMDNPLSPGWRMVLMLSALGILWLSLRMLRATSLVIELTPTELRDSSGEVLARVQDIEKVDRGVFALRPSNGFSLVLRQPGGRCWRPGLWWRMGRRVAVGGVTSGAEARPMADAIAALIAPQTPA